MPLWDSKRSRCQFCKDNKFSYIKCIKCNMWLSLNKDRSCFIYFHTWIFECYWKWEKNVVMKGKFSTDIKLILPLHRQIQISKINICLKNITVFVTFLLIKTFWNKPNPFSVHFRFASALFCFPLTVKKVPLLSVTIYIY